MSVPYANLTPTQQQKLQVAIATMRSAIAEFTRAVRRIELAHDAVDAVVSIGSQLDGAEVIPDDTTIQALISKLSQSYSWNSLVNAYNQLAGVSAENTTNRKTYWSAAIGPENMP